MKIKQCIPPPTFCVRWMNLSSICVDGSSALLSHSSDCSAQDFRLVLPQLLSPQSSNSNSSYSTNPPTRLNAGDKYQHSRLIETQTVTIRARTATFNSKTSSVVKITLSEQHKLLCFALTFSILGTANSISKPVLIINSDQARGANSSRSSHYHLFHVRRAFRGANLKPKVDICF